jgi:hypothetical protein
LPSVLPASTEALAFPPIVFTRAVMVSISMATPLFGRTSIPLRRTFVVLA